MFSKITKISLAFLLLLILNFFSTKYSQTEQGAWAMAECISPCPYDWCDDHGYYCQSWDGCGLPAVCRCFRDYEGLEVTITTYISCPGFIFFP